MDVVFPNATHYHPEIKSPLTILAPPSGNLSALTPSFLLSGPALLSVTVLKADPTAERYVLEYTFNQEGNITALSFVYDTPGSKQHRELSAKFLLDNQSKNLTLLLQGVDNKFEAHGKTINHAKSIAGRTCSIAAIKLPIFVGLTIIMNVSGSRIVVLTIRIDGFSAFWKPYHYIDNIILVLTILLNVCGLHMNVTCLYNHTIL